MLRGHTKLFFLNFSLVFSIPWLHFGVFGAFLCQYWLTETKTLWWAPWELEIWPRQKSRSFTPSPCMLTAWPSGLRRWFLSLTLVQIPAVANIFFPFFPFFCLISKKYVKNDQNVFFDGKKRQKKKLVWIVCFFLDSNLQKWKKSEP